MKKYQSIEQFKNIIRQVKDCTYYVGKDDDGNPVFDKTRSLPTLEFTYTIKSHGTNAGVRLDVKSGKITCQSRERELSIESDNAGFCLWFNMGPIKTEFEKMFSNISENYNGDNEVESIVIFGEWCGGNIQKGVAITDLPKMFLLFEVHVCFSDEDRLRIRGEDLDLVTSDMNGKNIYSIGQFETGSVIIDFKNPEIAQDAIVKIVDRVEQECPIGKFFGKTGIGEGIVLTHQSEKYKFLQFKAKGAAHSNSKVKVIAPVDIEKFAKVDDFINRVTTNERMVQGINYLKEMGFDVSMKSTGQYIQWINKDIFKEFADEIIENQLDAKIVSSKASNVAREFLTHYIDQGE